MLTGPRPMGAAPETTDSQPQPGKPAANPWSGWRSVLAWLVLALVLRWAVIEPRWIPSGSMLPTLQLQDRILVEKLRPRLGRELLPGTIVVFHPPAPLRAAGYDPSAALIKRVVAAAGDRVEVRDGQLWRNGIALDPDWTPVRMEYSLDPFTVPQGHLMVLGDNRNASLDSHLWGPLPEQAVIGTAVLRYWPLNRIGPIRFPDLAGLDRDEQLG